MKLLFQASLLFIETFQAIEPSAAKDRSRAVFPSLLLESAAVGKSIKNKVEVTGRVSARKLSRDIIWSATKKREPHLCPIHTICGYA
ncbi:hypothetical protein F4775DRAFT_532331 [Biscogniauxia sp. FL1348]|nr:hypothetical protein F4775DRAFT_532331 [Biscogniauxia sp. FL1348]